MKKIGIALVIIMALSMAPFVLASTQDKYTVSGEVRYSGESNIYVCLYNQDTFRAFVGPDREMPHPGFVKIAKADAAGRAPFAFADVPKGKYLIIVFADENSNGKLDRNTWGNPVEPTCSYKASKAFFWDWNDQKFEVDKDTSGLVLSFSE
jgi:uncharacterized protein (DUF2141 family)